MIERPADELFWLSGPVEEVAKVAPPRDGLTLLLPARVDLGARKSLPAVLRRKASMRDDMLAPLQRFGVVVALDLGTDQAFAGLARPPLDGEPTFREPAKKALSEVAPMKTTQQLLVDLRAALVLPWRAGELLIFAAARTLRSEPMHVVLQGGTSGEPPPAPEREAAVISRETAKSSPPLPAVAGIALKVDAKDHLLHGAYRLRSESFIHLVFCGRIYPHPSVFRLHAQGVEGHFTVDLSTLGLGSPQPYTVWAVSRDAVGGPAEVASIH